MPDYVSLSCPSCGSRLQVTNDLERFACGFCGNELLVRRSGGVVSLAPVLESLQRIEHGIGGLSRDLQHVGLSSNRTASELAVPRLEREIEQLHKQVMGIPSVGLGWPTGCLVFGIMGVVVSLGAFADDAAMGAGILAVYVVWSVFAYMWRSNRLLEQQIVDKRRNALFSEIGRRRQELENHLRILHE